MGGDDGDRSPQLIGLPLDLEGLDGEPDRDRAAPITLALNLDALPALLGEGEGFGLLVEADHGALLVSALLGLPFRAALKPLAVRRLGEGRHPFARPAGPQRALPP